MKFSSLGLPAAILASLLTSQLPAEGASGARSGGMTDPELAIRNPGAEGLGTIFSIDPATGAETVLHSFGSGADGVYPYDGLTAVNGILYGTTRKGGTFGKGTVFSIDPASDTETVVYSFGKGKDGEEPVAGLVEVNGLLYGTTSNGGSERQGTTFSVDPATGSETVLHSFGSGTDGAKPAAHLIDLNGALYGTTMSGGTSGHGTVYSIDPGTGAETVLYSFTGSADGSEPVAGLTSIGSTLYGTTFEGGTGGFGTVFSLDPATGAETVLHAFCQQECRDGGWLAASVIDVNGTLYGTASNGGVKIGHEQRFGTVFAVDPATGAETTIYTFCSVHRSTDARDPVSGLVKVKGVLYGTTSEGGDNRRGAVFSIDPASQTETVLHSFDNADGARPAARLLDVNGILYGTTVAGGTN